MALPTNVKVRWGYIVAFSMLLISYYLIFFIIQRLSAEMTKVSHSYAVINNLESIKGEITDAETGVRGYVITSDPRFLKPYNTGSKNVLPLYKDLRTLLAGNREYQKDLDTLGRLISTRLSGMASYIRNYQINGYTISAEMRSKRERTKNTMDSIRITVRSLQDREKTLMGDRSRVLKNVFRGTEIITIASLVIAFITIIYSLVTYRREKRAKEGADRNASSYSIQLEERVSELNRVNLELQELKSIEKFAATGRISRTIAHEVRNPLTNISLAAEQLKDMGIPNAEAGLLLDMVSRNANRINQMVSDLLNSTRFAQLEFTMTNINDLLDETLELANDRIELDQVRIERYYDKKLCEISVDKAKIKLAFLNIIVNAIEAMKKGEGVLKIRTVKLKDKCLIEFTDNGIGMDEDTLQKLFEPYFTVKANGNGLGLTNSQNIILNHKGNISARSRIGHGATFAVTLPEIHADH